MGFDCLGAIETCAKKPGAAAPRLQFIVLARNFSNQ